jgi:hypothetical protein
MRALLVCSSIYARNLTILEVTAADLYIVSRFVYVQWWCFTVLDMICVESNCIYMHLKYCYCIMFLQKFPLSTTTVHTVVITLFFVSLLASSAARSDYVT